jgi:hypothetical protein
MFPFSDDLTPNREHWPLPQRSPFLPASGAASYACASDVRNMLAGRSMFERASRPGCAWAS